MVNSGYVTETSAPRTPDIPTNSDTLTYLCRLDTGDLAHGTGVVFSFSLSLFQGRVPLSPGMGFGGSRTIGEMCGQDDDDRCCDDNGRAGARFGTMTAPCVDDCVVVVVGNVDGAVVVAVETTQLFAVVTLLFK